MALDYKQLGQVRPGDTAFHTIATVGAGNQWINGRLVIANNDSGAIVYYVCHDNDGTTADESTALAWGVSLAANTTVTLELGICCDDAAGTVKVKSGTADKLTFTFFAAVKS